MEQIGATWARRGVGPPLKAEARALKQKSEQSICELGDQQWLKTKAKARMDVTSTRTSRRLRSIK